MDWRRRKRIRKFLEGILTLLLLGISMVSVMLAGGIVFWLVKNGLPMLNVEFLMESSSILKEQIGLREYLGNTVMLLLTTLFLGGGVGIITAVYLCEYVEKEKVKRAIYLAIEVLAGIPSIVFGLFGMVFFGEIMGLGYSLLCGAFTLTIMILPIVIANTQEALNMVPKEYRTGALALGAGKWQMIQTILLPGAVAGIGAGLTLSAGKILGETAALLFTAGSKGSLAVAIYMLIGKGMVKEAAGTALVLMGGILLLKLLQQYIKEYQQR